MTPANGSGEFLSIENLKHCEARFRAYMSSKHGMDFDTDEDASGLRRLLYGVMKNVRSSGGAVGTSIKALNNATLNTARDTVLRSHSSATPGRQQQQQQLPPPPQAGPSSSGMLAPQLQQLQRDGDVYGRREVLVSPSPLPSQQGQGQQAQQGQQNAYQMLQQPPTAMQAQQAKQQAAAVVVDVARMTQTIGAMAC